MTEPQPTLDPDLILEANYRFDRTYPRDDGIYRMPIPDWYDPAPPGFWKFGLRDSELNPMVWGWLRRGVKPCEQIAPDQ